MGDSDPVRRCRRRRDPRSRRTGAGRDAATPLLCHIAAAGPEIRPRASAATVAFVELRRQRGEQVGPAAAVRSSAWSRRQRAIRPWSPRAQHLGHLVPAPARRLGVDRGLQQAVARATPRPASRRCRARRAAAGRPPPGSPAPRPRRRRARSRRARPRSPRSRVAAWSSTRWSMPSYRPQAKIRCDSAASSCASAWVNGAPAGVGTTSRGGRRASAGAARPAPRPTAPAASPCPGPPPYGRVVDRAVHVVGPAAAGRARPTRAALRPGPPDQRQVQRGEVLREDRDDVDPHAGSAAGHRSNRPAGGVDARRGRRRGRPRARSP